MGIGTGGHGKVARLEVCGSVPSPIETRSDGGGTAALARASRADAGASGPAARRTRARISDRGVARPRKCAASERLHAVSAEGPDAAAGNGAAGATKRPGTHLRTHLLAAIACFFRSIALGAAANRSLQDILRLLTLWFQHGADPELGVHAAILTGLEGTPVDTWLAVTPQLIARINSPSAGIRTAVHDLLVRLGRAHPQGLCFPLTVAAHSHAGAGHVLNAMRKHFNALVDQVDLQPASARQPL